MVAFIAKQIGFSSRDLLLRHGYRLDPIVAQVPLIVGVSHVCGVMACACASVMHNKASQLIGRRSFMWKQLCFKRNFCRILFAAERMEAEHLPALQMYD